MALLITFCHIIFLVSYFLNGTGGCSSKSSYTPTDPGKQAYLNNSNAIHLDRETTAIVEQTVVKTLVTLGKLKFHCPQQDGFYPDMLDCAKYYNCQGGNFTVAQCDPDQGYEPLAKSCIRSESVPLCQRVQKLSVQTCNNETGLRVAEGNCEKFILCTGDAAFISSCNHGDFFDSNLKLCLPEGEANCTRLSDDAPHKTDTGEP